ncbi:glycan-binding surface protein [Marinilabilia sp.]|uniref:glycan-binding surface protein n=1 Tax=Marinilabilia sp. TaxID=2021252 RepID=UPI0025B8C18F|nr:glycan-binding surface protein [Marinilabilia sp.]
MKKTINIWLLLGFLISSVAFFGCEDDEDPANNTPITVKAVYLQDVDSDIPDRQVDFARLGQVLRLEGSGFAGIRKVYVNGYDTYFNPVYVTDNNMLIQLSGDTPTIEAEDDVRNTIRFVKTGTEYVYDFEIRAASPAISSISHTLPQAGESIIIYGSGLVEISKVVFPGDVEVTEGITSDEEGEFVIVTVPDGLTESGSLFVEGSNGGAYSPAYFNFKEGVILDFDGNGQQGFWSWSEDGSMINDEDLESEVIGMGPVSQGTYVAHRPDRIASFPTNSSRNTEVWTAGNDVDDWRGQLTSYIPATTPVNEVAFQFDVYVSGTWSGTGFLKLCLHNSFNGGEWSGDSYNYVPWVVDGEIVPFETDGWVTVTVPFSDFYSFSDVEEGYTFEDVLVAREESSYKNFGIYFENTDFTLANITGNDSDATEFPSSETSVDVFTDNWRVVSLEQPTYTDFPEGGEQTEEVVE